MNLITWRRLSNRVEIKPNGCWNWTGATFRGYGTLGVGNRKTARAHRVVYSRLVGAIEPLGHVHHLCENTVCVNPSHLHYFEDSSKHMNLHKTSICCNGHRLEGDNLVIVNRNRGIERRCFKCHRERCLKSWHRRKGRDRDKTE